MKIIEANEGTKIPYTIDGTKIDFNDEIAINLEKRETDDPMHIDISMDMYGCLVMGVSNDYVAQIDIPTRQYNEVEIEDTENGTGTTTQLEPVPFSMDNVTLTLFALREGVDING